MTDEKLNGKMNKTQKELMGKLELALAFCVHDKHEKWAEYLGKIISYLDNNEYVIAVLEAEALGFDSKTIETLRVVFDVKRWS